MGLILVNGYEVDLAIQPKDKDRHPAQIDGVPVWSCSNSSIIELIPKADGLSCRIKTLGPVTDTPVMITVTADADLGEGYKEIRGSIDIDVPAGEAVSLDIVAGTPRPITP